MALFGNESDKSARPGESAKPAASSMPHTVAITPVVESGNAPMRLAKPAVAQAAYLDRGARVSGKLNFEGPVRIDGEVDGEIMAKDVITIGESAVVKAQIKGASIIVSGSVSGEMSASQRIEIHASARVSGNISAPKLIVEEGAVFEGNCSMKHEPAIDDRKAVALRSEDLNGSPREVSIHD